MRAMTSEGSADLDLRLPRIRVMRGKLGGGEDK